MSLNILGVILITLIIACAVLSSPRVWQAIRNAKYWKEQDELEEKEQEKTK